MEGTSDTIRVLVADRHALFREALRTVLHAEGSIMVVAEARDAHEAILEADRTLPHVVLLDVDLPGGEGTQATALLRERLPDCRVVVLTPVEDYRFLTEVLDAGANGYLTRESALADLIHATKAVHGGETLIPPRMVGALLSGLLRRRREQDTAHSRLSRLTRREREVLALLADGANNEMIARDLLISPQTARTHIQNILGKLEVHSRLEAAAFVTQNDLLGELVPADR